MGCCHARYTAPPVQVKVSKAKTSICSLTPHFSGTGICAINGISPNAGSTYQICGELSVAKQASNPEARDSGKVKL